MLLTETSHPKTQQLSSLAQHHPQEAIALLNSIDQTVVMQVQAWWPQFLALKAAITACKGRVFLLGAGASGRLAVNLEYLWRQAHPHEANKFVAVIAGGDIALIRAVEQFEDLGMLAARQLTAQGFSANDLLIGLTASGTSAFILAGIAHALARSSLKPWLLCCNPKEDLLARDPNHILLQLEDQALSLTVGPMVLTGSTRMQATTIMMLAFLPCFAEQVELFLLKAALEAVKPEQLSQWFCFESAIYQRGDYILYKVPEILALPMLADTTERSPTFNLPIFENSYDKVFEPAMTYLVIENTSTSQAAWRALLQRAPVCLNWENYPVTQSDYLFGFDLSETYLSTRAAKLDPVVQQNIILMDYGNYLLINGLQDEIRLECSTLTLFSRHLLLRIVMNTISTLAMGRVGAYDGNRMTHLKPSNQKLIERAIRYLQEDYLKQHQQLLSEARARSAIETALANLKPSQSIVKEAGQYL